MSYNPSAGGNVPDGSITTAKMGGDVTTIGKSIVSGADAPAVRSALGLGTAATSASSAFAAASHAHAAGDITSGTVATARLGGGVASSVTFLRGDQTWATPIGGLVDLATGVTGDLPYANLTPATAASRLLGRGSASGAGDWQEITLGSNLSMSGTTLSATGGGDPWTYVVLGSDFSTTSATAVDVTGMNFTPSANTRYTIEALLLTRTATATVGPRPGVAWPTGMTDGVMMIDQTSAAGTRVLQNGNVNAAVLAPVGGNPNNTQSYPATLYGVLLAGASPSGTFRLQLASETGGTSVTIKAGSFLRYRTY